MIQYLNRLGLKPSKGPRQFWNDLEYRHGRRNLSALKKALENRSPGLATDDVYVLKNQSLALSLDFSNYSADLYRRFFEWWVGRDPVPREPKRILDLGCDNGIVTCFLASLYPEATVIGVDIEENAVACANALAAKLALCNVKFQVCDVTANDLPFESASFDCIVSVRSFHEILEFFRHQAQDRPPLHFAIKDLLGGPAASHDLHTLQAVRQLLRGDEAELISFERLPWMASVTVWVDWLAKAGLAIGWQESGWISFQEVGQSESMPVLVCRPGSTDSTAILQGIYRLCAGELPNAVEPGAIYLNEVAEAIFHRAYSKRLLAGLEVEYPEEARLRIELWEQEGALLYVERTNLGYRKVQVLVDEKVQGKIEDLRGQIRASYEHQGLSVREYDADECAQP